MFRTLPLCICTMCIRVYFHAPLYEQRLTHVMACMWSGKDNIRVSPHFSLYLRQALWPMAYGDSPISASHCAVGELGLKT